MVGCAGNFVWCYAISTTTDSAEAGRRFHGIESVVYTFLLYLGYRVGSILGMIFAVPVGLILLNLYQAGAFDYILDDVKILAEGILSLRE